MDRAPDATSVTIAAFPDPVVYGQDVKATETVSGDHDVSARFLPADPEAVSGSTGTGVRAVAIDLAGNRTVLRGTRRVR